VKRPRARRAAVGGVVILALLAPATVATAGPARAPGSAVRASSEHAVRFRPGPRSFHITRNDGNDVKGPLDLKTLTITRGRSQDVLTFKTQTKVTNAQLDPNDGNFAILIDGNDNQKYDFAEYVFYASGKLRNVLVNLSTNKAIAALPASRLSGSSFRAVVAFQRFLGSAFTYRFALISYYQGTPCSKKKPCVDAIPNRFPLIPIDRGRPTARFVHPAGFAGGLYAADGSAAGTFSLDMLLVDDRYGVGIGPWTLESRQVGAAWAVLRTGKGVGVKFTKTVSRTESAPGEYEYRLQTSDRQGNRSAWSAPIEVAVPFDETDATVTPTGTWTSSSPTGAFGGTVLGSSTATDTIAFAPAITGKHLCVMLGPTSVDATTADASIDGGATTTVSEGTTTVARSTQCFAVSASATHTLTLTIGTNTAPFVVDGFYVTQG
jgi:hypothetical protein